MPYSGPDDPKLPSNVKKRGRRARSQWVNIWNSVFRRTRDEGAAFRQANSVVTEAADGVLFEAAGSIRAVFIREGVSKNGNKWTRRILESLVKLIDGVPVNLYDSSAAGNKTFFAHWESWRQRIPPGIRRLLPTSLPEARVGTVRNPQLVVEGGRARVEGDIEPTTPRAQRMISGLIRQAKALGRALGPSIHIAEGDIDSEIRGHVRTPTAVTKVTGFEIVSFPSAGGAFLPVLEALEQTKEDRGMSLIERLLRLLTNEAREKLTESVDIPPDTVKTTGALTKRYPDFVAALFEALEQDVPEGAEIPVLEALATQPEPPASDEEKEHLDARKKRKAAHRKAGEKTPKKNASAVKRHQDEEARKAAAKKAKGKDGKGSTTEADEEGEIDEDGTTVTRAEFDALSESMQAVLTENNRSLVESRIKAARLPEGLEKFAIQHWTDMIDEHGLVALESVDDFLADLRKGIGRSQNSGGNLLDTDGDEGSGIFVEWNSGDKAVAALEAMLADREHGELVGSGKSKMKVPAFSGLRQAYGVLTGDIYLEGRGFYARKQRGPKLGVCESIDWEDNPFFAEYAALRGQGVTEATITTATFPLILSNYMHKAMVREYKQMELKWRLIGRPERVTDFKDWRFLRLGEFANLPTVNEGANYTDWSAAPDEEEITLAIAKHGGYAELTWETLVNDDLRKIRSFPGKMSRAAARTLNDAVFNLLANNSDYTTDSNGGVSLANAAHSNYGTTAYSFAQLKAMRAEIAAQKDLDDKEPKRATARHVLVGSTLYDSVYEDLFSDGLPVLDRATAAAMDSDKKPNVLRSKYGLDLHEITQLDANDYWVTADPAEIDMIAVGFLNGQQNPQMFVQDLDRVGTFFDAEKIRWKIRHIWAVEILDYRGFSGRIVA